MSFIYFLIVVPTGLIMKILGKDILRKDDDIIDIDDVVPEEVYIKQLSNVFVNGYWLGYVKNSIELN